MVRGAVSLIFGLTGSELVCSIRRTWNTLLLICFPRPWVTDLSILQSEHSAGGQGEARGEVDCLQRGPGDWGLTEKLKLSGIRNEMCLV